jgi:hypothetical protein
MNLTLKVDCYSGHKADERPIRFTSATHGGRTYALLEVLDQWYGEGYQCFKVRADDGNIYILRHTETDDGWTLDSFRQG